MSLRVETNYVAGVPQTVIRGGLQCYGQDWHWTAAGTGRAGAEAVIRGFVATRYTTNASYHLLVWSEHKPGHVGCITYAMWIVPPDRASHSLNPANCWKYNDSKPRAQQDTRFAEVRRILGPKASDPNAGSIAVSYCGMPADLARDVQCPVFVADCRKLSTDLAAIPTMNDRPHFAHGWIQPITRYEMDSAPVGGTDLIISKMYAAAGAPAEEDEMTWVNEVRWYKTPRRVIIRATATYRLTPDLNDAEAYVSTTDEERVIIGEVNGLDFGAGPLWLVIGGDNGVPKVVHSQDVIGEKPLVSETVKEVLTGLTDADIDKAVDAALDRAAAAVTMLKEE